MNVMERQFSPAGGTFSSFSLLDSRHVQAPCQESRRSTHTASICKSLKPRAVYASDGVKWEVHSAPVSKEFNGFPDDVNSPTLSLWPRRSWNPWNRNCSRNLRSLFLGPNKDENVQIAAAHMIPFRTSQCSDADGWPQRCSAEDRGSRLDAASVVRETNVILRRRSKCRECGPFP